MSHQDEIIREVRDFADQEIRPYASVFETNEAIPRNLIQKMASRGYLGACFPKEYGGLSLDPIYYGYFTEEIGKACCSTRSLLTVHTSLVGETILRFGNEYQKKKWLPAMVRGEKIGAFALSEPEIGSDAKSVRTSYCKQGSAYVLNGRKKWITFGGIADLFMVIASNNEEITAFLVERDFKGVTTIPIKGLLASRAAYIAEVVLENVTVPEENVLGRPSSGFTYIVSSALDSGRYSIAWAGLAIAQEAFEQMVTYSRTRSQFGQKIRNFQLVRGMIADALTKIHAARALCLRAGKLRQENNPESAIETMIAKFFSSQIALQVASDAVQVHGANGCCSQYSVERLFREAKLLEIIEGTSQILQNVISSYALRNHSNSVD